MFLLQMGIGSQKCSRAWPFAINTTDPGGAQLLALQSSSSDYSVASEIRLSLLNYGGITENKIECNTESKDQPQEVDDTEYSLLKEKRSPLRVKVIPRRQCKNCKDTNIPTTVPKWETAKENFPESETIHAVLSCNRALACYISSGIWEDWGTTFSET